MEIGHEDVCSQGQYLRICGLAAYGVEQAMNYEFMIGLEVRGCSICYCCHPWSKCLAMENGGRTKGGNGEDMLVDPNFSLAPICLITPCGPLR